MKGETVTLRSGQANVTVERHDGQSLGLAFAGTWTLGAARPSLSDVLSRIVPSADPAARVVMDGHELVDWDSQFLVFLRKLAEDLGRQGFEVDFGGLPDGVRRLLELASAVPLAEGARRQPPPRALADRVGRAVQGFAGSVGAFVDFLGETVMAGGRLLSGRARFPVSDFAVIVQDCGIRALPIVSLIAVLVGLIIAFVGSVQLQRFGAGIFTADMVAIAMLREMGALMTAIIMAGRTGAAFAAELATMQVNEEIDALATLGIDPIEYLVLPRVLALTLMMPPLCLYADILGIVGGGIIGVTMLDISFIEYWTRTINALGIANLLIGLHKAAVFGGLIALAGCLHGLTASRSAAAVGVATTSAVVLSIVLIVTVDGVFAVILNVLGL